MCQTAGLPAASEKSFRFRPLRGTAAIGARSPGSAGAFLSGKRTPEQRIRQNCLGKNRTIRLIFVKRKLCPSPQCRNAMAESHQPWEKRKKNR